MRSSKVVSKDWRAPVLPGSASRRQRIIWTLKHQPRESSEILDPTQVKLPGLVLTN